MRTDSDQTGRMRFRWAHNQIVGFVTRRLCCIWLNNLFISVSGCIIIMKLSLGINPGGLKAKRMRSGIELNYIDCQTARPKPRSERNSTHRKYWKREFQNPAEKTPKQKFSTNRREVYMSSWMSCTQRLRKQGNNTWCALSRIGLIYFFFFFHNKNDTQYICYTIHNPSQAL